MTLCLKHRYPFRLATTSFIHRAGYAENVRLLAPWLDEIELLFLECEHPPTQKEIEELRDLSETMDITYNIHLPMDISLADPSAAERRRSREAVLKILEHSEILNAAGHVLHVNYAQNDTSAATVSAWQDTAVRSLARLIEKAGIPPQSICIETLDFPPHWLNAIVSQLNLPVCVDVGHVIHFGYDLEAILELFSKHIGMFHLHGVSNGHDHLSLDHLHCDAQAQIADYLKNFNGAVSLEVFSYEDWTSSMACFKRMMTPIVDEPAV